MQFLRSEDDFENEALKLFRHQAKNVAVYSRFLQLLKVDTNAIQYIQKIPFLPVQFFKHFDIISENKTPEITFTSSGTTGLLNSRHLVADSNVYKSSFRKSFELFYGDIKEYCILALLPSYLERTGSSLIYMAEDWIKASNHPQSGFYLHNLAELHSTLQKLEKQNQKTLLLGVSFALLDFAEQYPISLKNAIIMETGGMKGKRKELIREEMHAILQSAFKVKSIHSEYGMTELLSQAYSYGEGIYKTAPWMKILIRDPNDPFQYQEQGKAGGINIIDLANQDSCAFIATQDLGKLHANGKFEVLGRFDNSDIRGCNLMAI